MTQACPEQQDSGSEVCSLCKVKGHTADKCPKSNTITTSRGVMKPGIARKKPAIKEEKKQEPVLKKKKLEETKKLKIAEIKKPLPKMEDYLFSQNTEEDW